jgi:hypothetical protein
MREILSLNCRANFSIQPRLQACDEAVEKFRRLANEAPQGSL